MLCYYVYMRIKMIKDIRKQALALPQVPFVSALIVGNPEQQNRFGVGIP